MTTYQTTHLNGGAIMGTDPKTSALNRYLQSWDVPNLFVMGASAFPQNAGYNPTGTVAALAFLVGRGDPRAVSQEPGAARSCVGHRHIACSVCLARRSRPCPFAIEVGVGADSRSAEIPADRARPLSDDIAPIARRVTHGQDGGKPFAGGRPLETPFGTIVTPNITPDRETGIGDWTDEQFDNAVRRGIRRRRRAGFIRQCPILTTPRCRATM